MRAAPDVSGLGSVRAARHDRRRRAVRGRARARRRSGSSAVSTTTSTTTSRRPTRSSSTRSRSQIGPWRRARPTLDVPDGADRVAAGHPSSRDPAGGRRDLPRSARRPRLPAEATTRSCARRVVRPHAARHARRRAVARRGRPHRRQRHRRADHRRPDRSSRSSPRSRGGSPAARCDPWRRSEPRPRRSPGPRSTVACPSPRPTTRSAASRAR